LSNILGVADGSRQWFDERSHRFGASKRSVIEVASFCAIFHFCLLEFYLGFGVWDL
jgi:hypothetical protein